MTNHPDIDVTLSERDRDARAYVLLARAIDTPEREIELDLEERGYSAAQMAYLLTPTLSIRRKRRNTKSKIDANSISKTRVNRD